MRSNIRELPSADILRQQFLYEPETGIIRNRATGDVAGRKQVFGYLTITTCGDLYMAHRIAWALHYGACMSCFEIDHINGTRDDNRIANLRLATSSQNRCNSRKLRIGLPKGVRRQGQKFSAAICLKYKVRWLGTFPTIEAAKAAYDAAAKRLHGAFARP